MPELSPGIARLERGLFYALLALLFWLPIPLGSHRPWAWALMEVWVFVMLAGWLVVNTHSPRMARLRPYLPLLLIFGVFQLWVAFQLLPLPMGLLEALSPAKAGHWLATDPGAASATLSLDPNQTHIGLLKGLAYCGILFLVLALVDSPARLKTLALTIVLAGTFQAFYGVLMALSGSDKSWVLGMPNSYGKAAVGGFVYKNHFGNFLVLCLSLGTGLLIAGLGKWRHTSVREFLRSFLATMLSGKAVVRLCLAMMVIGLVMSHSRMANTAFFASLSVTGVLGLLLIRKKSRSLTVLLASMLVIDLFIVGSWFGVDKLRDRIENSSFAQETRDEVNQYGTALVEQYPFTGTGGGSFYSSFPSVKGPGINTFYDLAHNDYLQFAIEFGLPATLLLGVVVLWSLVLALQALRRRRQPLMQGMAFAAVMAIVAELVMLLTDFHLQAPATAVYFMLCLGLAWMARYMKVEDGERVPGVPRPAAAPTGGVSNFTT
ncbi:O-antigen ligase family protein [Microbulbifer yueqingensis]|uniref:O-Antigen ligase n=1 Tax=Microbulbifer yueqingensis TaxID=658219 RepID=A0A1G8VM84_9GAMM|nr:O-antigen ligase family protein [Microbulbifer yueqingensis]SDJ67057.1 O-Antigen ligase [Microbulbifer yueqingensis]